VLKYTFNSVANNDDAVSAYIFSSGVPAAEPGTADIVTTDVSNDLSKVYGFAVRQGTAAASAIMELLNPRNSSFVTSCSYFIQCFSYQQSSFFGMEHSK
jgi:hypothetical protein